jgi:DNA-binding NarL/FixJ family response regulator
MLIVCSGDMILADLCVELCIDLFNKRDQVKHLSNIRELTNQNMTKADLLIIDLEYCREKDLPQVQCPTMVLATVPVHKQAMRLLQKGVRAYGNRHMHKDNLLQAALALKAGQVWLPPNIINQMITSLPRQKENKNEQILLKQLSQREQEVAKWVINGLSNKEIAEKMFISIRTVKAHLTSIFSKTGCRDRLELATRIK